MKFMSFRIQIKLMFIASEKELDESMNNLIIFVVDSSVRLRFGNQLVVEVEQLIQQLTLSFVEMAIIIFKVQHFHQSSKIN